MTIWTAWTAILLVLCTQTCHASDPEWSQSAAAATKLATPLALVQRKAWSSAIMELHRIGDRHSADWNSLMGYALHRQTYPDFEAAHWYYERALQIDPNHFGTLEHVGHLHLTENALPKAQQRLQTLGNACELSCFQYHQLKAAIERQHAKDKASVAQP